MDGDGTGYLEVDLPPYLQLSIDNLKRGIAEQSSLLDCLLDDLYGSINSAVVDGDIDTDQAKHLRRKYLGIEP